jgi:hypothetical protein
MDTRRVSFSLDIPADGSPAFGITSSHNRPGIGGAGSEGTPRRAPLPGGLTWLVRMNFLVAVSSSTSDSLADAERRRGQGLRNLVQDGTVGAWGVAHRAGEMLAPLARAQSSTTAPEVARGSRNPSERIVPGSAPSVEAGRTWASILLSSAPPTSSRDSFSGDDDVEGLEAENSEDIWEPLEVHTVECEVPIAVWPGATAFRPQESVFEC